MAPHALLASGVVPAPRAPRRAVNPALQGSSRSRGFGRVRSRDASTTRAINANSRVSMTTRRRRDNNNNNRGGGGAATTTTCGATPGPEEYLNAAVEAAVEEAEKLGRKAAEGPHETAEEELERLENELDDFTAAHASPPSGGASPSPAPAPGAPPPPQPHVHHHGGETYPVEAHEKKTTPPFTSTAYDYSHSSATGVDELR